MAKQLQLRKGTATEHNTFTGANGEVTVDTTNKTLRVHDGSTVGGIRLATCTGGLVPASQLPDATTSVKGAVVLNNTLTSTSTTQALTAAQGKVLKDTLDTAVSSSLGVGQTWQDMHTSRAKDVTYTNTTGRVIAISIVIYQGWRNTTYLFVNGRAAQVQYDDDTSGRRNYFYIIPPGANYSVSGTSSNIEIWDELR